MNQLFSISIPKGTTVLCVSDGRAVELLGDVYVQASRHDDGAFGYCVNGRAYAASAGTVQVL